MARLILRQSVLPRAASWSPYARRGGHVTFVLQWLLGFEQLGHDVMFVNTVASMAPCEAARAVAAFEEVVGERWHRERSALLDVDAQQSLAGCTYHELHGFARHADALITIALTGERQPPPPLQDVRPRIFVDQDPGYTQLWAETHGASAIIGDHDVHFTVGANVGSSASALPTSGIAWKHTWNPVVLDWWPSETAIVRDRFTTVADWWGQPYVEFGGQILGPKREEFLRFKSVARQAHEVIELALDIPPEDADLEVLAGFDWKVTSPAVVESVEAYRTWIAGSLAEFSCVKGVYAGTNSGWFSDRSAGYLASARPVVLQDTALAGVLPTGEGLLLFRTVEEAVEAIRAVRLDYERHALAARSIAVEHFDSRRVLTRLLRESGVF